MAIKAKPIKRETISFTIKGDSPLIQHNWSEKARKEMKDKHAGKKTKSREARNPEQEFKEAHHYTESGSYGVPAGAIKKAIINAAHKDIGIEKTLVRKSLFVLSDDPGNVLEMDCSDPIMREDFVRVGAGSADLRYRPEFRDWSVDITVEIDAENLTVEDVVNIVNRAGFGVGLHEMRPEKGGDFGRFSVDVNQPVTVGVEQ